MIEPNELDLKGVKDCLPKNDPRIKVSVNTIPASESKGRIIPVCEPTLIGKEKEYLLDCIETNWISSAGKYLNLFEKKFSEYCGAKYGICCMNGTVALHLALAVLGIKKGDEVIIPTFTMIATSNAVTYTGAKPVLVDSELRTWNMDETKIEEKITDRTKAIIPVHTYGHPCDLDKIYKIANKYNLYVVEDAAEAHGAEYKGKRIGSISIANCFSFYANKIITTGEGGMITTNNEELYKKAQVLRDHAFSPEIHFWHKYLGYNYRMTNLRAAVGLAQVEVFDELVSRRIKNAMLYNSLLKDVQGIALPPETPDVKNVYWMYSIRIEDEFKLSRDELRNYLAEHGIETRTFFIPIHLQPIFYEYYKNEQFPNSEYLCKTGLYLPSSGNLTRSDIEYIVDKIKEAQKNA